MSGWEDGDVGISGGGGEMRGKLFWRRKKWFTSSLWTKMQWRLRTQDQKVLLFWSEDGEEIRGMRSKRKKEKGCLMIFGVVCLYDGHRPNLLHRRLDPRISLLFPPPSSFAHIFFLLPVISFVCVSSLLPSYQLSGESSCCWQNRAGEETE